MYYTSFFGPLLACLTGERVLNIDRESSPLRRRLQAISAAGSVGELVSLRDYFR